MSLSKQDKNSENKDLHEAFKYLTNKCLLKLFFKIPCKLRILISTFKYIFNKYTYL